jgi:hypothetical protein
MEQLGEFGDCHPDGDAVFFGLCVDVREDTAFPGGTCIPNASSHCIDCGSRDHRLVQDMETLNAGLIDSDTSIVEYGTSGSCRNSITGSSGNHTAV